MEKVSLKYNVESFLYKQILKPVCFSFEPEKVHNSFVKIGKSLGSYKLSKKVTSALFNYQNPMLEQDILGIHFKNPIGLSAGFDKNAELIDIMGDIGFGFVEVGSITAKECKGNNGVRLKRVPERNSLLVNLGLNNIGADAIKKKLMGKRYDIPFGVSIAYTNCKENSIDNNAIKDYIYSLRKLKDIGNYFTINISCPNTYGGQPFTRVEAYRKLITEVGKIKINKPIFLKISPDLNRKTIDEILNISYEYGIKGIVCTNLTKKHDFSKGGMSGKYLEEKANELLKYVYKKNKENNYGFVLVGVGGVFSANDAYKKIKLGANLVQLITGMIYNGPQLISEINRNIVKMLKEERYKNITEVVGIDNKQS
ncbi:MAG: quinone-dependent dihydroorotate dehydrogenase [Nanoarchaeota archaeon]|nr:quinone-dependent dihydroorotate dehydrogenase [Nanoarchaeota archaeon]